MFTINMNEVYFAGGVRTPIGNFGGALSGIRADDLAAHALAELLVRFPELNPEHIDDVFLGCANQAGEDNRNVARMALLLAGYPWKVPGETINRLCASGLSAVAHAYRAIACGEANIIVAGGVEHMTRGPLVISKAGSAFGRDQQMFDSSFGWRFVNPRMKNLYGVDAMGETAENLAEMFAISREDQDLFAFRSQKKAADARARGWFSSEVVSVPVPRKKDEVVIVSEDEFPKPGTSIETLMKLKPAFRSGGTVTAGNSSGLNDGAAALLFGTKGALEGFGIRPIARVIANAAAGSEPRIMGIGPVEASRKVLKMAGLDLSQIDVIELNEAFAAQVLACTRELGLADDDARLNPNGGAIALGHPLGMSGSRLLLTAARQLADSGGRYALVTMCIGVGQGFATIIERV
jgi:3-oxoadipyl-CoA thiolase